MKNNEVYKILSSEAIKETMKLYDKSMTDISKDLHIPYRTIQNWCGGVSRPPIYVINLIDEYYWANREIDKIHWKLDKASDLLHDGQIAKAIEIIEHI